MAFSLTFHGILDHNIRHIYSGHPSMLTYRHAAEYPNMDQLRQRRENQILKNTILRTSEYRSDYRCLIPRAPAYRQLSPEDVEAITSRLRKPTIASTGLDRTSETEMQEMQAKEHPKYLGLRKISSAEMEEIVARLSKPTRSSTIREAQIAQTYGYMPPVEVE